MERFVKVEIFDSDGKRVWRTFNLRYVRHFDEEACRVMLNGAHKALLVEKGSMRRLVEAATTDVDAMSERIAYLQARVDALESSNRWLLDRLSSIICRPWWRKLFGL